MSKRRKAGDWVWLMPNSGFVGESHRLKAEIQPEIDPPPCFCDDPECVEWTTLWTENDGDQGRHTLCHVSECRMLDEIFQPGGLMTSDRLALHEALAKAHNAHPLLRLGQLVVAASAKAAPETPAFYIPDDELMIGLGIMVDGMPDNAAKRMSDDMPDDAAKRASRIRSYLARKVGASLDGETVDDIAQIIRD